MAKQENIKTCFVIAPIDDEESETRMRSDKILKYVIIPVTEQCDYCTVRADKISEPGIITSQVIQHLIDDDLVIADLTEKNPNVFYELAVRHTVKKPVIQIIQAGESIPFDVSPTRTIHFDYRDLDSVANCQKELIRQIHSVENDPSKVDSPISVAIDLKLLYQSENLLEKSNAEIIYALQDIKYALQHFEVMMNQLMQNLFEVISKQDVHRITRHIRCGLTPLPFGTLFPSVATSYMPIHSTTS